MPQKPVTPADHQPCADKRGHAQGTTGRPDAQHRPNECETACADLHLSLQFERLAAIGYDRQSRLLPGIEPALDDEGFAGAARFLREPGGIGYRSRAALAMKDDWLPCVQREVGLVQLAIAAHAGRPMIFSRACSSASRISIRIAP